MISTKVPQNHRSSTMLTVVIKCIIIIWCNTIKYKSFGSSKKREKKICCYKHIFSESDVWKPVVQRQEVADLNKPPYMKHPALFTWLEAYILWNIWWKGAFSSQISVIPLSCHPTCQNQWQLVKVWGPIHRALDDGIIPSVCARVYICVLCNCCYRA